MTTHQEQWVTDGFPWCDTCDEPCVWSEGEGTLHVTPEWRWGVPRHLDQSGHAATMRDWSEQGIAERRR